MSFKIIKSVVETIKSNNLALAGFLLICIICIGFFFFFLFEFSGGGMFKSISDVAWWALVTVTTVGYGDFYPVTTGGRIVGAVIMLSGIAIISIITASISSVFIERKLREGKGLQKINSTGHLVLCGWNHNTEKLLQSLQIRKDILDREVVIVNDLDESLIADIVYKYKDIGLKFIRGDHASEVVLDRANIKDADSVIILPDLTTATIAQADEKTILATLTIKSLAPKVRVYAHILSKDNESYLKKANIDDIIISDEHVDFLLISHIMFPGIPQAIDELLTYEMGNNIWRVPVPSGFKGKTFKELAENLKNGENLLAIGLIREVDQITINDVLSGDYSYLDQFIERKFKEAGKGVVDEGKTNIQVNPPMEHEINDESHVIVIGAQNNKK